MDRTIEVITQADYCVGRFDAMASPCEILIDTQDKTLAQQLTLKAAKETWRIQDKFSRYDANSLCTAINNSQGKEVAIDSETFQLLNFAQQCYSLSEGLFDITSGCLRRAWQFDGSDNLPTEQSIQQILPFIGWKKVQYNQTTLCLPQGMEIDFGGVGKEYAVDKVSQLLLMNDSTMSMLVNFGGDLCITTPRSENRQWTIGIENPNMVDDAKAALSISQGALATSGDSTRFLVKNGQRYSHILNPKTGWPIKNGPRSVTVAAPQCLLAGMLSTLALLQGEHAQDFLDAQGVEYWCMK